MLTAHTIIKNEENWIWYAIHSVLPFVSRHIIFDTGSSDLSIPITRTINSPKLVVDERGTQEREGLVALRNVMLERTKTEWFLLVDGDEIWPSSAMKEVVEKIAKAPEDLWGIVVRTRNCVGDVWHYQSESAGKYELLGKKGHLSIRAYRKLPGFHWEGVYPNEAYCDEKGNPINGQDDHLAFVDVAYWHVTHLPRSRRSRDVLDRISKYKLEVGIPAKRPELPEVFFSKRPQIVPSPWIQPTRTRKLLATLVTPMRKIKRRLLR